ncbi:MAG: LPS assembly lipoprotein LptE [Candidatus Omnitrophota bacterium]
MRSKKSRFFIPAMRCLPCTLAVWGVLCSMLLSGCGYTTRNAALPSDTRTIHVELFKNSIDITKEVSAKDKYEVYRPGLEVDLRDAIVNRIFLDGHLRVASADRADSIMEGEIIQYRRDPLRYQNEDVREYRISLVCDIMLRSARDSNVIVKLENITGDTTYFTTGSLQKSESQALTDAASDLARRIVNRIVESW